MLLPLIATVLIQTQTSTYRAEYPLPGPTVPQGLGVDIHFVIPPSGEVEKIAKAGYKWVRMDFWWPVTEKHPPAFNFRAYDMLMNELDKNHIRPVFILNVVNQAYGQYPGEQKVQQAFCRMVAAAVEHYKHRGVVWEFWNEPNLDDYWKPHANADEYVQFAKQVGETIRSVSPDEWYIAPALSHWDWPFLESCFQQGLLEVVDGISVHPYRSEEPESAQTDWAKLKQLIKQYAPPGRRIAMISGEWGYSDLLTGIDQQAQYAVRMYLANMISGADFTIWYDWSDDTDAPEARQRHFGATYSDGREKLLLSYLRVLREQLDGYHLAKRLPTESQVYVLVFEKGADRKMIAWTSGDNEVNFGTGPKMKYARSLVQSKAEEIDGGTVELDGTPKVIY